MFNKKMMNEVLNCLKTETKYFVSEAHLQMSFILEAFKLYKDKYAYYPEYPIRKKDLLNQGKNDEIDLAIVEIASKEKTFVEFKHKTKNISKNSKVSPLVVKTVEDISFKPSNMGAQNLGRFDCWSDIERLEKYKAAGEIKNAFFVFITNDELYLTEDGADGYGNAFSMKSGDHVAGTKTWAGWQESNKSINLKKLKGIGKGRNRAITINKSYTGPNGFKYVIFQENLKNHYLDKYWCLLIDIL